MWYRQYGKRAFDLILASLLIVLTLPIQLLITILLGCIVSPKFVFFRQKRIGQDNKPFDVIKFTSLIPVQTGQDVLEVNPKRAFGFGTWIRKTVLDELPQLYQILTGQMSLIGPRPLLPEYLKFYNAVQLRRHNVRPGITGWAQVHGGNTANWSDRLRLDVEYADNYSWQMDMLILKESFLYFLKAKRKEEPSMIPPWKGE